MDGQFVTNYIACDGDAPDVFVLIPRVLDLLQLVYSKI